MLATNISSDFFLLNTGAQSLVQFGPGTTVEIEDSVYAGNQVLKDQIDSLVKSGKAQVSGVSLIEDYSERSSESFPGTFDVEEKDLIIYSEGATAGLAVNEESSDNLGDDRNYGVVKLRASDGGRVELYSSYESDSSDGSILVDNPQDSPNKHFDIRVDGFKLTLASDATVAEVVAYLIDLGLAEEE